MEYIIIAIAAIFNLIIIKVKLERKRYEDALFDGAVLFILSSVFAGTYGGMVIATIASAIGSLYLLACPPKFLNVVKDKLKELKEDFA
jgi:uncharacterized membrane protein